VTAGTAAGSRVAVSFFGMHGVEGGTSKDGAVGEVGTPHGVAVVLAGSAHRHTPARDYTHRRLEEEAGALVERNGCASLGHQLETVYALMHTA
jgi:hypothetical protein